MEVAAARGRNKLAFASIGFAEVRVGGGGGGLKDDGLLGAGLPKDAEYLFGDVSVRMPDVGAAVRVRNFRSQCLGLGRG